MTQSFIHRVSLGLLFCAALCFAACGHSHEHTDGDQDTTEHSETHGHDNDGEDHAGHDHAGHDHDGHAHNGHDHDAAAHGASAAFTSAYVCPMHCKGSGSDAAGSCPVCKMDYVAHADHVKDGHKHE